VSPLFFFGAVLLVAGLILLIAWRWLGQEVGALDWAIVRRIGGAPHVAGLVSPGASFWLSPHADPGAYRSDTHTDARRLDSRYREHCEGSLARTIANRRAHARPFSHQRSPSCDEYAEVRRAEPVAHG
jgi:hypothetical protein